MQVTERISPIGAPIRITDPVKIESQMNQLAKAPLAESVAVSQQGRELPRAPCSDPYVHLYAYGSYLGCLTANRWLGQG